MISSCCPGCRVRFAPATAAYLVACPECGKPPEQVSGLDALVGFRLVGPDDGTRSLPEAIAVSLPIPGAGSILAVSDDRERPGGQ